jgi:aarF domain-containing kinase
VRLTKAKLILEQISSDEDQLAASTTSLLLEQQQRQQSSSVSHQARGTSGAAARAPEASRNTLHRTLPQTVELAAEDTEVVVIPDNLWSNDHLLDSSSGSSNKIVTRWARGKKVAEPLVKYDPVAAEAKLWKQINRWVIRNFQIAIPLGYWAVSVVLDYVSGRSKSNRRVRAAQLRSAISDLGPAIIKGGQALASRPDLLPSEYLEELQKLQDDVPRFSNTRAFQTVEEELGIKFEDVFELVEPEPVAAASIGQVYKARLVENGDLVALKIQRPRCEEVIALDLYVLRWWGGIYNQIFRALNRDIDVQAIIDDFGELIYREIDYVAEASNAQRFNELYAGVRDVFVPKIYSDLTTSKVLTMEWVDGFRLTDAANLQKYNLDESKLVDTLVQCSLRQILGTHVEIGKR